MVKLHDNEVAARIGDGATHRHDRGGKKIAAPAELRFGVRLRRARLAAGLTQEELAEKARISPRHVSFLETGKAHPGRDTVLALGEALHLAANERNALLGAAGFAALYTDMAPADRSVAIETLAPFLAQLEPVPAIASDPFGYFIAANAPARQLAILLGGRTNEPGENIYEPFFLDDRMRAVIPNWAEMAPRFLRHLEREAESQPPRPEIRAFLARIRRALDPLPDTSPPSLPVFRFELAVAGTVLRFTSSYSTFGVPYDATMQSIRIESFVPSDDATRHFLERLTLGGQG